MHRHLQFEEHYVNRSGWLRAAVLGANDGILSTSSLVIGIAAATDLRNAIVLAALAGIVAGAFSMAAGEYVSVSSQSDIETADLVRERRELETMPEAELGELAKIYEGRGLQPGLALEVAKALTEHNALEAHAKDELGINEITQAKPFQAALASGASFISGGLLPLLVALFAPVKNMILFEYVCSILFLAVAGVIAARAGGSSVIKGMLRVCFWGTVAMGASALVGYLFGVHTS
ncbi:VIT1/CCC1 transporter family protein [Niabella soli]|uniref:Membrane protein n=1 Tax=Niabella soli DSM 19437 TaxID=929713 RepID=W0EX74_9BACT|nr:VIT family protein [Niabella soli]AHF15382.1 membrane protein [Niabella soli DSM 19437]